MRAIETFRQTVGVAGFSLVALLAAAGCTSSSDDAAQSEYIESVRLSLQEAERVASGSSSSGDTRDQHNVAVGYDGAVTTLSSLKPPRELQAKHGTLISLAQHIADTARDSTDACTRGFPAYDIVKCGQGLLSEEADKEKLDREAQSLLAAPSQ
jgi:hypothetical protein